MAEQMEDRNDKFTISIATHVSAQDVVVADY
jgi:hypothetical protein